MASASYRLNETPMTLATIAQPTTKEVRNIPFKADGSEGVPGGHPMLLFVLIIAGIFLGLREAKKRGWLDGWIVQKPAVLAGPAMRLEQTIRLSPKTVIYVLSDLRDKHVVVESSANLHHCITLVRGEDSA